MYGEVCRKRLAGRVDIAASTAREVSGMAGSVDTGGAAEIVVAAAVIYGVGRAE